VHNNSDQSNTLQRTHYKKDQLSAKIEIAKDGPYLVMGKIPLAKQTIVTDANGGSQIWREGDAIRVHENYALC
jgi:hypothetical protein